MSPLSPDEDRRANIDAELRRARARLHDLGSQLETLAQGTSALQASQPIEDAHRLGAFVLASSIALNELAMIAGKLAALGAVMRDG
jgi:hypothetical protein